MLRERRDVAGAHRAGCVVMALLPVVLVFGAMWWISSVVLPTTPATIHVGLAVAAAALMLADKFNRR